jgi:hypothetical protein
VSLELSTIQIFKTKNSHVGRCYKTAHAPRPLPSHRIPLPACRVSFHAYLYFDSIIAMQPSGREMAGADGAGGPQADDFFDQMLSTLPSAWADLGGGKSPWEQLSAGGGTEDHHSAQAPFGDESVLLASRLRQHQIGGDKSSSPVMLQLSDLHRNGGLVAGGGGDENGGGFSPLPLFTDRSAPAREEMEGGFKSPNATVRSACRPSRRLR